MKQKNYNASNPKVNPQNSKTSKPGQIQTTESKQKHKTQIHQLTSVSKSQTQKSKQKHH